jgi:hypothetical protein
MTPRSDERDWPVVYFGHVRPADRTRAEACSAVGICAVGIRSDLQIGKHVDVMCDCEVLRRRAEEAMGWDPL